MVTTALAAEKSVLAVKGLKDMPLQAVVGTIDVWWMIHDGAAAGGSTSGLDPFSSSSWRGVLCGVFWI